jgi:hypothetical protein
MILIDADLHAIESGIECFNNGRYWEAHEEWEHAWRKLQGAEKAWLQSYILAAGAFFLLQKGRFSPAQRLAQLYFRRREEGCESWLSQRLRCQRLDEVMGQISGAVEANDQLRFSAILASARTTMIAFDSF